MLFEFPSKSFFVDNLGDSSKIASFTDCRFARHIGIVFNTFESSTPKSRYKGRLFSNDRVQRSFPGHILQPRIIERN